MAGIVSYRDANPVVVFELDQEHALELYRTLNRALNTWEPSSAPPLMLTLCDMLETIK